MFAQGWDDVVNDVCGVGCVMMAEAALTSYFFGASGGMSNHMQNRAFLDFSTLNRAYSYQLLKNRAFSGITLSEYISAPWALFNKG
jgi:hypothetical protein